MQRTWRKKEPLIQAHVKDLSVTIIEKHIQTFREVVGPGKSGIYVLRKDRDVYYVGLASSLRARLAQHMKDHHKGEWNRFDLYFILPSKLKYLKELETILIRVARPRGCRTEPDFVKHNNLTGEFKRALLKEVSGLFPNPGR